MDKIICDVCGTSYPESSAACPICGYAKSSASKSADGAYQFTKGGRFSSSNVRKRNEEKGIPAVPVNAGKPAPKKQKQGANFVFGIVALILLFALIALLAFFIVKIINERAAAPEPVVPGTTASSHKDDGGDQNGDDQQGSASVVIRPETSELEFLNEGEKKTITLFVEPEELMEDITFQSVDSSIAVVDEKTGVVEAIAPGETKILISCGDIAQEYVKIVCNFEIKDENFWKLNREEFSFQMAGQTHDLLEKTSRVPRNKITWTSSNENVAKVENGHVTSVYGGEATITAEYNGVTYSCLVRCKFEPKAEEVAPQPVDSESLKISHKDVTIYVEATGMDKSFELVLKDKNGNKAQVTWTASKEGYISIEGNTITAVKALKGSVIVSCEYEGKTYSCEVRVKQKKN